MQASTLKAATKLAVSAMTCDLRRVQGYFNAANDAWLQIHDAGREPAAGAIPKKTYQLFKNAAYSWAFDPGVLEMTDGCYIAVSSTEATYTTVPYAAGVTWCDIEADYSPFALGPFQIGMVGDTTTGRDSLVVWADGGVFTAKRLQRIDVTNGDIADLYLLGFNKAVVEGAGNPAFSIQVPSPASKTITFGDRGRCMAGQTTAKVPIDGCYLYMSNSAATLDTTGLNTACFIRAFYTLPL